MNFLYPSWLWLLALIPALAWFRARRRGAAAHFPDGSMLRRLPVRWTVRIQPLFPALVWAGMACLIIAAARPRSPLDETRVSRQGIDILLLLDLSGSMEAVDFLDGNRPVSRLEGAKTVVREFIENRPNDRIGLVGFAGQAYTVAPLTFDHAWITHRLGELHTRMLETGTAIGDAIATGANRLRDSDAQSRVLILLTDGINNRGIISPEMAATAATALGIRIYTIGVGGGIRRQGFFRSMQDEIDEPQLRRIAQMSNGEFFRATDRSSLSEVYRRIDELETSEIETLHVRQYRETAGYWLLAALSLLCAERILSLAGWGRFPE